MVDFDVYIGNTIVGIVKGRTWRSAFNKAKRIFKGCTHVSF